MLGTSRSLHRSLQSVFEQWDSSVDWEKDPSPALKDLYGAIYAWIERHNSMATLSSTINDDLRDIFSEHIESYDDLSKQTFFLELLARMLPVLSQAEVEVWLKTYLRPALDSAGLDLSFVRKSREFLRAVAMEPFPSPDAALLRRRVAIADLVMEKTLQVYLGQGAGAYAMIGLEASELEQDTQLHIERIRFLENNAAILLRDWALKNPVRFFNLIDPHFKNVATRQKVLLLAAKVASENVAVIQKVIESPFFPSLLTSLLHDRSESILGSALTVLLMLFCKVCDKLSKHLPDLLLILARLISWKEHGSRLPSIPNIESTWDVALPDQTISIMQTPTYSDGVFDCLYFVTLLYGLFPVNLVLFAKGPRTYFEKSFEALGTARQTIVRQFENKAYQDDVALKTSSIVLRLMVHPNILAGKLLSAERDLPIQWILDKNRDDDVGEIEVLLECLRLNPEVIFLIPDNVILPAKVLDMITAATTFSSESSERRIFSNTSFSPTGSMPNSNRGSFQLTNELISAANHSLNSILPSAWQSIERRVSVVPTRLILDHNISQAEPDSGEVSFRTVDFDGRSFVSESTIREDRQPERKRDQLSELYTVHEKLFTSSAPLSTRHVSVNTDTAHTAVGTLPAPAGETASNLLTKQLQNDLGNGKRKSSVIQHPGSAIDFYQRELLLIKNEMEFSSYIKHVNQANFVKLKLKYNKLIHEQNLATLCPKGDTSGSISNENPSCDALQDLRCTLDKKTTENTTLLQRLEQLQEENRQLKKAQESSKLASDKLEEDQLQLKQELDQKICEIVQLKNSLQFHESPPKTELSREESKSKGSNGPTVFPSEEQKRIAEFAQEVERLSNVNTQLSRDIQKAEDALAQTQKDLELRSHNEKAYISKKLHEQTIHYERKIKDLNNILVKYEMALDEEKTRVSQLSKARPISIPGMQQSKASNGSLGNLIPSNYKGTSELAGELQNFTFSRDRDYFAQRGLSTVSLGSASLSSTPSLSKTPAKPAVNPSLFAATRTSSSSIPIVKGRGGYQKRSKKIM